MNSTEQAFVLLKIARAAASIAKRRPADEEVHRLSNLIHLAAALVLDELDAAQQAEVRDRLSAASCDVEELERMFLRDPSKRNGPP